MMILFVFKGFILGGGVFGVNIFVWFGFVEIGLALSLLYMGNARCALHVIAPFA
ncbi:MAG: hypothetical protein RL757_2921 [Bacteroidota bacterium]